MDLVGFERQADNMTASFIEKIQQKKLVIGVLGIGYVGLPLIVAFAEAGFKTWGFDLNSRTVAQLCGGQSHIGDVASERIQLLQDRGVFDATTDFTRLRECDVAIICVPTPLTETRDPDLTAVRGAAAAIAQSLHEGQLVILESTTYPGTTAEVVRPLLEAQGLTAGQDFFLAFSPERIDPGNKTFPINKVPKVVGGFSPPCLQVARALYDSIVEETVPVSSTQAAELTKLLENIFRSVNIALVNEMALLCDRMNIDVWEVIDAASTKPYGFTRFLPGPGLGGHCIPVDPFYLSWKARQHDFQTHFIELAGEINRAMPHHVVEKIARALNDDGKPIKGTTIALLGMSYKANIGDCRESPSLRVAELLLERGACLCYNDPYVPTVKVSGDAFESQALEEIYQADCVVLLTDHQDYEFDHIASTTRLIVDTRNAFKNVSTPAARIVKL
ncbi:UDP-N-acetyl-D-glucosamine 6-dehydrogenase [Abditibacteriota bacterium]|nr:UDP-N-acetyl-D-glucosamine 6-dehydrogenase [Abditibacteriota bacterium]